MRYLVDRCLVLLILITPLIRVINGYMEFVGEVIQVIFLLLFLLKFLATKNDPILYLISGLLLFLFVAKIYLYGFDSNYIKIIILFALVILSLDEDFKVHLKAFLCNNKRMLIVYVVLLELFIYLLTLLPEAYYEMYGVYYFRGSMVHPHTMAYECAFIILLVITLFSLYQSKWVLLLTLAPIYFINLAGVRTVILAMLAALMLVLIRKIKSIKAFIGLVFSTVSISYLFLTLLKDNIIMQKFLLTNDDVSSGRFSFWLIDLKEFVHFSILEKFLGNSFDYLESINYEHFGISIGAHNDAITFLLGLGIVGLTVYVMIMVIYFRHVPIEYALLIAMLILLNGYYSYSEIVYIMPVLALHKKQERSGVIYEKNSHYRYE